ncbi:hypothetical protein JCM1840_005531 [Sporobolomyces johnsonii]
MSASVTKTVGAAAATDTAADDTLSTAVPSVALSRQRPSPEAAAAPDEATSSSSAAATTTSDAPTTSVQATQSSTASPSPSSAPARASSTRAQALPDAVESPSSSSPDTSTSSVSSASAATVLQPLNLATALATSPLSSTATLSLSTAVPLAAGPVLLTSSSSQGFVISTRRPSPFSTDVPPFSASPSDQPVSRAQLRSNSSATITGISLAVLVGILLALVMIPKLTAIFKRPKEADEDVWGTSKPAADRGIEYIKRSEREKGKDDDEVSWFSGSTADGGLSDSGSTIVGDADDEKQPTRPRKGETVLVHTLPYKSTQSRSKDNLAGIGRRDTLRSIINVPLDVPPPQAEFVAMPATPTIIYSPPQEDLDRDRAFEPPVRSLTPLAFPSTPSNHSFPATPNSARAYPPATPPLSGLYSAGEWQQILASPPDSVAPSPSPPPAPRSRRPTTRDDDEDEGSVYSRSSTLAPGMGMGMGMMMGGVQPFAFPHPPSQAHLASKGASRPGLSLFPMRLGGLAGGARADGGESFPVTPATEYAEEMIGGAGARR